VQFQNSKEFYAFSLYGIEHVGTISNSKDFLTSHLMAIGPWVQISISKRQFLAFHPTAKACGYIFNFNLSKEVSIRTTFRLDPSPEGT
jgi:hypothetical protein